MILNFYFQNDFFTKETILTFSKLSQNKMPTNKYTVIENNKMIDLELYKSLLFISDNSAGKTNLLNAIKFCLLVIEDNLSDKDQLFVEQYMANNNYKYKIDFIYKNKIATVHYTSFKSENRCSMQMKIDDDDDESCSHLIPENGLYNLSIRDDFNLDLINNIKNINNSLILNDCQDGNINFLRLRQMLYDIEKSTSNQLIFATHNPHWLDNNKYFSEEQIYFIDTQAKHLVYSLSDFDLTKIKKQGLNYRDAYLRGKFGAVPDLD